MAESKYQFDDPKAAFAEAERRIQKARKTRATELGLKGLGLTELPETLGQLPQLEYLRIAGNRLTTLPPSVKKLTKLRRLYVWNNGLRNLPEWLVELAELQELCVSDNLLVALPESIGSLKKLVEIDVSRNRLSVLPPSLLDLREIQFLFLHDNKELQLPKEILGHGTELMQDGDVAFPLKPAPTSAAVILDYYFRIKRPLNEAKLILLGRGEVGKTCLVNRLVHGKFASTLMTRGIAITQWPITSGKDTIRLHVWDFGGQEIQHATHQFFLTERSLYLVVLNGRAGAEDEDAEYWLKFVKTFGSSSPTIVVLNKFKVQPFQVNRRALQEKYPFIRAFVQTDCKPMTKNGIPELKREIESALAAMEHVRADFPAGWFQIKERLAEMKEPFISFAEYRKICAGLGENDAQAQERLAGFLNALGIALNFREDQQLREETVLNPHWITEGVYQIITSKALAERQGEMRLADLGRILPKKAYPPRMHGFLIELMRKFELCFLYHDDPTEHRYLVPELLGKEEPALKEPFPAGECLNFRFDYRLMPEGLLPRFITRTHTMSEPSERWRTGVVLRWEGCRALVKADKQERQVLVRVLGPVPGSTGDPPVSSFDSPDGTRRTSLANPCAGSVTAITAIPLSGSPTGAGASPAPLAVHKRRRLLAVIRENLDQIHAEMKEFKPTEWVALEGHPDEWVSYGELEKLERRKVPELPKSVGDDVVSINVTKVLDETDVPAARKRDEARAGTERPLRLFISYAHEDEKWRAKLAPNLALLEREGLVELWCDLQIKPGDKWDDEIKRKLEGADLYLFLVSTDLLASKYVHETELPIARQRHMEKKAKLVPVVVRACSWKSYFGEIQGLPAGAVAVKEWRDRDQAFHDVEKGLRKTIAEVREMLRGS